MKASVQMTGRLVADITHVFSNDDGTAERVLFTVATNQQYKGKDGNKKESVDFIDCIAWGAIVKTLTTWGLKGRKVEVRGSLETYQPGPDENGKYPEKKYQVRVDQIEFHDKKPETVETPAETPAKTPETPVTGAVKIDEAQLATIASIVSQQLLGAANNAGTVPSTGTGPEAGLSGVI